jgi:hypothetical protein
LTNWRGKKRSRARTAASRGNPWYEVFAARTRIPKVSPCTTKYIAAPGEEAGKTARAISERSETLWLGRAPVLTAR